MISLRSDIVGAVMAGGKSSRMGSEKALLAVEGRPMISYVTGTLSQLFSEVIICGADPQRYEFLGFRVVRDVFQRCGPLAGIHTALTHSAGRPVFVLSCDMPFVPPELVHHILASADRPHTRIAFSEGVLQPLCGIYGQECLPVAEEDLSEGKYSIIRMLKKVKHSAVKIDASLPFYADFIMRNVNRPEDYEEIRMRRKE